MCIHVIVVSGGAEGVLCGNHGELKAALGGPPMYLHDQEMEDCDCLCNFAPDATALKFGYKVDAQSDLDDVVLTRNLH